MRHRESRPWSAGGRRQSPVSTRSGIDNPHRLIQAFPGRLGRRLSAHAGLEDRWGRRPCSRARRPTAGTVPAAGTVGSQSVVLRKEFLGMPRRVGTACPRTLPAAVATVSVTALPFVGVSLAPPTYRNATC